MELKNSQSIVFNILTFYEVLSCVLIETVMCISALRIAPFEGTACVNTKLPDDGTLVVPKYVGKETLY